MKAKEVYAVLALILVLSVLGIITATSEAVEEEIKVVVKFKGQHNNLIGQLNSKLENNFQFSKISKFGRIEHLFVEENALTMKIKKRDLALLKKETMISDVKELRKIRAFLQESRGIVNATPVWSLQRNGINITGSEEIVCIIDTGVNFTHPDLLGKNASCVVDCVGKPCILNCSLGDDNGHGTHVAGIIGANGTLKGVAPGVKIVAVKVLDSSGNGDEADLKAGIDFCVSNFSLYNISVISMSLGTDTLYSLYCDANYSGTPNLTKSVNDAIQKNISVIAATGNSNNKNSIAAPACIRNATAVTSSTKSDGVSSFSNSNSLTDLIAPGSSINSTLGKSLASCTTQGVYMICSGTSMSTPHVAAAFAMVRQFKRLESNKILSPFEIEDALKRTGKIISDSNGLNFSRIDIIAAVQSLQNPLVSLVEPKNSSRMKNPVNFTCNASTDSNFAHIYNITFLLYNGTILMYNETKNTTGAFNQTSFNYTFSEEKNYSWACRASDNRSYTLTSLNFTLNYDATPPLITIISPENSTYKDAIFNISSNENISSCAYSLDHTNNISLERVNDTYFNFTESNVSDGIHNVSFSCNDSAGNFNATGLRQFTINKTKPVVILISPADAFSSDQGITLSFRYNVTHSRNISSCSLIFDNSNVLTNASVNSSIENNFTYVPSSGSHTWNINCTDNLGNIGNATSKSLTVIAPSTGVESLGYGGGGGNPVPTTHTLTQGESARGTSKTLEEDDKIRFILQEQEINSSGTINVTHYINVSNITTTSATFIIFSQPRIISLQIGSEKKIELTNDEYYDLFIRLNNITQKKVNITLKTIHDPISLPKNESAKIVQDLNKTEEMEEEGEEPDKVSNETLQEKDAEGRERKLTKIILMIVIILIVVLLLIRVFRKRGNVKKKLHAL